MKQTPASRLEAAFAAMDRADEELRRNAPPINIRKTVGELTIGTVFGNPESEKVHDQERVTKKRVKDVMTR